MALMQVTYFAKSLSKGTNVHVIIPNDVFPEMIAGNENYNRPMKTLFLLHGFSGTSMDWITGTNISDMAIKYNMAVVLPSADNSFYLNGKGTGTAYETFVGVELVEYIRKTFQLALKKEDTYIGGLSMGGFGALHTGMKYADTFGKIFALSSALIADSVQNLKPDMQDAIADYDYYERVFGDLKELEHSDKNPAYLAKMKVEKGEKIQPIYMACGLQDFLLEENRKFTKKLLDLGIDFTYKESEGIHDWNFWNEYLEPSIQFLIGEENTNASTRRDS